MVFSQPHSGLSRRGRSELDRVFEQFFTNPFVGGVHSSVRGGHPALNVWEDVDNYFVEAECPGYDIDDVKITIQGSRLELAGERRAAEVDAKLVHRRERRMASFQRAIKLPVEVDGSKVHARLQAGVLSITLPKAEAAKPRKIQVNG